MGHPKGDRLIVNLSAAAARRRLAGFGHGVRKVHSAGRNQAIVIHTASGRHLEELRSLFADVGCSMGEDLSEPIDNLRNIGATSAHWLRDAGIRTIAELRELGAVEAFQRVRHIRDSVSWNLLWALAAGLEDRDWRELDERSRETLRKQVDEA